MKQLTSAAEAPRRNCSSLRKIGQTAHAVSRAREEHIRILDVRDVFPRREKPRAPSADLPRSWQGLDVAL